MNRIHEQQRAADGLDEAMKNGEPVVLHVRVVSGTGGGPDKTILNSPRFLTPHGYPSVCVYLRDPHDSGFQVLEQRAAERRAPIYAVDDFGIRDWRIIGRLRDFLQKYPNAIWHGHDYKSNLLGLMLRRRHPMPLVTTVHGWVQQTWKTPLYYFVDRRCLPKYDRVICVSQDLFDDCVRLGVAKERLSLIDNAIALDDYEIGLSQAAAKQNLGFDEETFLVVAVGRLSNEKGFNLLIDAVARIIQSGHNIGLAIAGNGDEHQRLQDQIDELGLQDQIKLLGFVADPREVYRAADLYVLSSLREGLPNVVLEAMAMQLPVVATRVAGMPTLMEDNVNGRLVEPNRLEDLHNAIAELVDNSEARQRFSMAGRETIEQRFSFQKRMDRIVEVYRSL